MRKMVREICVQVREKIREPFSDLELIARTMESQHCIISYFQLEAITCQYLSLGKYINLNS